MARKTIEVAKIVEFANNALAVVLESDDAGGVDRRWGIIGMVETALFESGNYKGYQFLPTENDAEGRGFRPDYDQTRRRYF